MPGNLALFRNKVVSVFSAIYRWFFSPLLHLWAGPGMGCRYQPTCGAYFAESVKRFGFIRGGIVGTKRLCSCHPWSRRWKNCGGWDPVSKE